MLEFCLLIYAIEIKMKTTTVIFLEALTMVLKPSLKLDLV